MKTLDCPGDQAEIVARLRQVRPDSPRRWGRMSAPQMVCHLADAFRMALGDRPVAGTARLRDRTVIKWIALYVPAPWPPGIRTRPELDQEQGGGTTPGEFAADVAAVEALIALVTAEHAGLDRRSHPIFGPLSRASWMRWAYLHMDHHLRQFGV